MPSNMVSFRAPEPLYSHLRSRGQDQDAKNPSTAAREMCERYVALMAAELRTVTLTASEAAAICDVLNGTLFDRLWLKNRPGSLLAMELEEAAEDGIAEKWEIDLPALLRTVQGWNHAQGWAVLDAVERFWRGTRPENLDDALTAAGLIRPATRGQHSPRLW